MTSKNSVPQNQSAVPPVFLVNTVLRFRRFLLRLADAIVPSYLSTYDIFMGAAHTSLMHVAAQLRIADLLKNGPLTSEEIAKYTNTHVDSLDRVMQALVAINVFRRMPNGSYANNKVSSGLISDRAGSTRGFSEFLGMGPITQSWTDLPNTLKDGITSFDRIHGESLWDWMAKDPVALSNFVEGMNSMTELVSPAIATLYPFEDIKTLCDVGGGTGTVLAAALRKHPHLKGILHESPTLLNKAIIHLNEWKVADRVKLVPGNFFDEVPAGADAYLLKTILHNWNDENVLLILRNCRKAMTIGNKILIVDFIHSTDYVTTLEPFMNLMGMCVSSGRERDLDYLIRLFNQTGFIYTRTIELPGRQAIYEAMAIN
jgi:O-methyltransferase domain/Dimerisation domain